MLVAGPLLSYFIMLVYVAFAANFNLIGLKDNVLTEYIITLQIYYMIYLVVKLKNKLIVR